MTLIEAVPKGNPTTDAAATMRAPGSAEAHAWMRQLEQLVRAVDGFARAEWMDARFGSICIRCDNPQGRAAASRLLRVEALTRHLAEWSKGGELWVYFAALGDAAQGRPQLFFRDGDTMLVSDRASSGMEEADGDEPDELEDELEHGDEEGEGEEGVIPATFSEWFRGMYGRAFPLPEVAATMRHIGSGLWCDVPVSGEEVVEGFPHQLALESLERYRLAGYGGYGINSWAAYYTDVRERCALFLRMPFGGACGDPDLDSEYIVCTITEAHRCLGAIEGESLLERAGLTLEVLSDMGQTWAVLRSANTRVERHYAAERTANFWDGLLAYVRELVEAVAPQPG